MTITVGSNLSLLFNSIHLNYLALCQLCCLCHDSEPAAVTFQGLPFQLWIASATQVFCASLETLEFFSFCDKCHWSFKEMTLNLQIAFDNVEGDWVYFVS